MTTERGVLVTRLRDSGFAGHQILPFLAAASAKMDKVLADFNAVDLSAFDFEDLTATVRWKIDLEELARNLKISVDTADRGLEILMLSALGLENGETANGTPLKALLPSESG
ncbi:MAG: hypothetical protein ACR2RB_00170 [Gammaproteobacteria bacterium]